MTSPAELVEQLTGVRSAGTVVESDDAVLGECGLASPVFDSSGVGGRSVRPRGPGGSLAGRRRDQGRRP